MVLPSPELKCKCQRYTEDHKASYLIHKLFLLKLIEKREHLYLYFLLKAILCDLVSYELHIIVQSIFFLQFVVLFSLFIMSIERVYL